MMILHNVRQELTIKR